MGRAARAAAALVDALAGLLLAMLLAGSTGRWFAGRAVVTFRIGGEGSLWVGPVPMALGMVSTLSYGLPFALLLVLAAEPLFGVTPGKAVFGVRVVGRDGAPAGRRRLWARAAVKGAGAWGLVLALLLGNWPAALLAAGAGLAVLAGSLGALRRPGATLHDLAAGTAVVRAAGGPAPDAAAKAPR